jgi:hypothetical protein
MYLGYEGTVGHEDCQAEHHQQAGHHAAQLCSHTAGGIHRRSTESKILRWLVDKGEKLKQLRPLVYKKKSHSLTIKVA